MLRGSAAPLPLLSIALAAVLSGCGPRKVQRPPEPVPARQAPRPLVGAGSCTSSGCHAASEAGHAAWQSAYTVWAIRDPHARAHESLRGPLAERIVAALEARDPAGRQPPAHENMACVGCHATGRGDAAGEGVSCESCHGAAEPWLVAHTAAGWKTRGNSLGMIDLADSFTCASTCASCHVGGPPTADGAIREVTHDLVAAGHPRLAFELRSYKRAEPPHWRNRFAAPPDAALGPLDEWAQGRLATLASYLRQTASQSQAARTGERGLSAGAWPEFTAFDCHGCHRPAALRSAARSARIPAFGPPGAPRLEPMYFSHLDILLPAAAMEPLSRVREAVGRSWAAVPPAAALAEAVRSVEDARFGLHERLARLPAADLARRLVGETNAANWAEAVSALGGIEAIADREVAAGRLSADAAVAMRLAALRRQLEFPIETVDGKEERFSSPRGYDPAGVAAELRAIADALTGTPAAAPGAR